MTALAMIIGMVPMAIGLGEGGEQNAPLGPRRDRRARAGDRDHPVLRPRDVQLAAQAPAAHRGNPMTARGPETDVHDNAAKPEDLGFELPEAGVSSKLVIVGVLGVLVAGGFAFGYFRHQQARGDIAEPHAETAVRVSVVKPTLVTSIERARAARDRRAPSRRPGSIRAPPATSGAGSSTSATRSRRASCSPRSRRRISTRSSPRLAPSSPRLARRSSRRPRSATSRSQNTSRYQNARRSEAGLGQPGRADPGPGGDRSRPPSRPPNRTSRRRRRTSAA